MGWLGRYLPSLGSLSMLTDLNLRSNGLSGRIPAELGSLSNLVRLNLHTNELSGPIPGPERPDRPGGAVSREKRAVRGPCRPWLNGMTEMRELWLWGNELRRHDTRPERHEQPGEAEAGGQRPGRWCALKPRLCRPSCGG